MKFAGYEVKLSRRNDAESAAQQSQPKVYTADEVAVFLNAAQARGFSQEKALQWLTDGLRNNSEVVVATVGENLTFEGLFKILETVNLAGMPAEFWQQMAQNFPEAADIKQMKAQYVVRFNAIQTLAATILFRLRGLISDTRLRKEIDEQATPITDEDVKSYIEHRVPIDGLPLVALDALKAYARMSRQRNESVVVKGANTRPVDKPATGNNVVPSEGQDKIESDLFADAGDFVEDTPAASVKPEDAAQLQTLKDKKVEDEARKAEARRLLRELTEGNGQ